MHAGITPFVTLFHFDLPTALQDKYSGFLNKQIVYVHLTITTVNIFHLLIYTLYTLYVVIFLYIYMPLLLDFVWIFNSFRDDFKAYADLCFKAFGDRVKHWITINEPQIVGLHGYKIGLKQARSTEVTDPFFVVHHIILAHAAAAKLYKRTYQVNPFVH